MIAEVCFLHAGSCVASKQRALRAVAGLHPNVMTAVTIKATTLSIAATANASAVCTGTAYCSTWLRVHCCCH
jgi:hypothetical protein